MYKANFRCLLKEFILLCTVNLIKLNLNYVPEKSMDLEDFSL